jgi:hypothetical protein
MITLLSLLACTGPYVAEFGSGVTASPGAVNFSEGCRYAKCSNSCKVDEYANEGAYLADCDPADGIGTLIFMRALVTNPNDQPQEKIAVSVYTNAVNIYVIPEGAIEIVEGALEACVADPTMEGCPEYFDAEKEQFFQIAGTYTTPVSDTGAPFRPNYMTGETNKHGLFPFYLFVDQAPAPGGTHDVTVDIQVAATEIEISTGSGG